MSLVYCATYAQLLVLRTLGGASYRTGIILVVVRMAAQRVSAFRSLTCSNSSYILDRRGRGTRPDAISTGLCRLRRLTYECRLEGDKTHDIFHFLSKKVGGHFLCGPHQADKWGGDAFPLSPTDLRPWRVHSQMQLHRFDIISLSIIMSGRNNMRYNYLFRYCCMQSMWRFGCKLCNRSLSDSTVHEQMDVPC